MGAVTIIGTGRMGRALGRRLATGGIEIAYAGRDADAAKALAYDVDGYAISLDDPITTDVAVLAIPYPAALYLAHAYADRLTDHIVIDVTNPVNGSATALITPAETSAAEQIAAVLTPGAHVVKAFNTTFAPTLLTGTAGGHVLDVLLAGDHEPAKLAIAQLITTSGLHPIDLGPLARARHLEAAALLHIAAQQHLGSHYTSGLKFVVDGR